MASQWSTATLDSFCTALEGPGGLAAEVCCSQHLRYADDPPRAQHARAIWLGGGRTSTHTRAATATHPGTQTPAAMALVHANRARLPPVVAVNLYNP